jgi:hypothetical protein
MAGTINGIKLNKEREKITSARDSGPMQVAQEAEASW